MPADSEKRGRILALIWGRLFLRETGVCCKAEMALIPQAKARLFWPGIWLRIWTCLHALIFHWSKIAIPPARATRWSMRPPMSTGPRDWWGKSAGTGSPCPVLPQSSEPSLPAANHVMESAAIQSTYPGSQIRGTRPGHRTAQSENHPPRDVL